MKRWGVLLLGWTCLCAGTVQADELLYYVEDGNVVFTNTPSRGDVRLVPGLGERVAAVRGQDMPGTPWDEFIRQLGRRHGVSPDLVKAVAMVESALDPNAISPKGAMGLMQLMPATAQQYGVSDPLDPYESLSAGTRHLRDLLDEFDDNQTLALAAYNAGSGAVRRYGGVPDYRETRNYVHKVQDKLTERPRRAVTTASTDKSKIHTRVREDGTVEFSN